MYNHQDNALGKRAQVSFLPATAPLARYPLDSPPARDGMAAAGGRLFLSTLDGKVVCWAPE